MNANEKINMQPIQWEKPVLYSEEWMNTMGELANTGEGESGLS